MEDEWDVRDFPVGSQVLVAIGEQRRFEVPCPFCRGKKTVVVIDGDNRWWDVECQECGGRSGMGYAKGVVEVTEWVSEPQLFEIVSRTSYETTNRTVWKYEARSAAAADCGRTLVPMNTFRPEDMAFATARCFTLNEQERIRREKQERGKTFEKYTYAYNLANSRKEIKRAKFTIAFHEKKVVELEPLARQERLDRKAAKAVADHEDGFNERQV